MSYSTPHKVPPPWFRCVGCGRNRAGHDAAEKRVAPHLRHDFITVTEYDRRRHKNTTAHPTLIPTNDEP